jgi:hypothetical protein
MAHDTGAEDGSAAALAGARWLWDAATDSTAYNTTLQFRRRFRLQADDLPATGSATLAISALVPGPNTLTADVLSVGTGTMGYVAGEAGLIFALSIGQRRIVSDARTWTRPHPGRQRPTVRRWLLPCIEDVDAGAPAGSWRRASVCSRDVHLTARRVPLATRAPTTPQRLVCADQVLLPNVALSVRLRPYVVAAEEQQYCNNWRMRHRAGTAAPPSRCFWTCCRAGTAWSVSRSSASSRTSALLASPTAR